MKATLSVAVLILAAAAPCLPLRQITQESIARVRDFFLLGMLGLATIWCVFYALPFAPIGIYFLAWWRTPKQVPSLIAWGAMAVFWALLTELSEAAWVWLPRFWLGIGAVAVATLTYQWYEMAIPHEHVWWNPYRPLHKAAWFGQRISAACLFPMILPFCPWWALPVPLLGLAITCSWTAFLAACAAALMMWPTTTGPAFGGIVALGAIVALWRPIWLEYTPRGSSLDSVRQRVVVWRLFFHAMTRRAWWPWGYGPRTMEKQIIRWGVAYGMNTIPLGHPHFDVGHFLYEYGLCGIALMAALGWQILPHLAWGDPWSAAWVGGVILCLGAFPTRVAPIGLLFLAISVRLAI
jgi:hypothetical protein